MEAFLGYCPECLSMLFGERGSIQTEVLCQCGAKTPQGVLFRTPMWKPSKQWLELHKFEKDPETVFWAQESTGVWYNIRFNEWGVYAFDDRMKQFFPAVEQDVLNVIRFLEKGSNVHTN